MIAFAEEVNALLGKSTLLLSSEGGNIPLARRQPTGSLRDIRGWMERRSFMQTVTILRHAWSNTASMQFQIIDERIEEYSEIIK